MIATVYSKNSCPFCVQAKLLLNMKGVEIVEHNFQIDPSKREELFEKAAAINVVPRTAPQIWLDDEYIGGFDQLKAYYDNQG
ncbi:glutaredoxin [bacterium]|nr:glutaredoxin [bacterium]